VKLGDKLPIYLVQNPPRARALTVTGLYTSGLETELGREVIFGDMKPIVKLNQWDNQSFGGVKVKLKPGTSVSLIQQQLRKISGSEIQVETIQDRFPNLLSWLSLFDVNEQVLMIVLLAVVGINILSALLVLIVERTRLAALLNVMGASPGDIRKLFLGFGIRLVFKGLLIGNLLAGMLFLAQKQFSLIRLDEAVYYVSAIPLNISAKEWLMLNFWMFLASCLVLIVPTTLIQRIKPAQALRFS
jgi:lipoprotein-releasing system permease protein